MSKAGSTEIMDNTANGQAPELPEPSSLELLIRGSRHFSVVFLAETKRLLAYRAQFWFELVLSSIIELFVAVTVWRAVFASSKTGLIGGYTYEAMVVYATSAVFVSQAVRGTNIGTFARDIYDGTFTKFLVYPLSVYSYKLGTFIPRSFFGLLQLVLALLGISLFSSIAIGQVLYFSQIPAFLMAIALAALLYFMLLFCIESLAFWADHVWALSVMLQAAMMLLSGKLIPLSLFPEWAESAILWSPFPYLVYFPIQVLFGRVEGAALLEGFLVLLTWLLVATIVSSALYRRGVKNYSGVGM